MTHQFGFPGCLSLPGFSLNLCSGFGFDSALLKALLLLQEACADRAGVLVIFGHVLQHASSTGSVAAQRSAAAQKSDAAHRVVAAQRSGYCPEDGSLEMCRSQILKGPEVCCCPEDSRCPKICCCPATSALYLSCDLHVISCHIAEENQLQPLCLRTCCTSYLCNRQVTNHFRKRVHSILLAQQQSRHGHCDSLQEFARVGKRDDPTRVQN